MQEACELVRTSEAFGCENSLHLPCFKALSVLLDLTESSKGKIVVSKQPERIDDLVQTMVDILDKGYFAGPDVASFTWQAEFHAS